MQKKISKKTFTLSVVSVFLVFSLLAGCAANKAALDAPQVSGYELTDVQPIPMVQGTAFVFEHTKSGARIIYVQNDDTNLSFSVAVSTPPEISKGLNHILEHMMLSSSKQYPGKEVFFGAVNTTLNTYMNAFTAATYTMFPFSTTDELQYKQLADYYMSSVFEPTLDENTFMREGWRYDLAAASDPLAIKGVVYSEMQGANANILRALMNTAREELFSDTVVKNDSGGSSTTIPTLTLQEIQAYHAKYFVPSNSIIGIYGNMNVEEFMVFLDKSWLSNYKKQGDLQKIKPQKPFTTPKTATVEFPTTEGTPTEKKSATAKSWAISNLSAHDIPAFMLYITILENSASPLMENLQKSGLADSYFISLNPATRQMQFEVIAQNINPSDVQKFENIVLAELENSAKHGFDKELFDSIKAQFYAQGLLARENTGIGVNLIDDMAMGEIIFNSRYAFATAAYDVQDVSMDDVRRIAEKYLIRNRHTVLVTANPVPGLTEKNAALETERLAKIKADMSTQHIETLVKQTVAFTTWLNAPDTLGEESLKKLQVLRPDNLQNTLEQVIINDAEKNGVRYIYTPVPGQVSQQQFIVNLSNLSKEELLYAKVYARLLGNLGTDKLSYKQVGNQLSLNTLGYGFSVSPFYDSYLRTASYPVFTINWLSEEKNRDAAQKMIESVLFDTKLDEEQIKIQLGIMKASAERSLQSGAAGLAVQMSKAAVSYPYVLQEYLGGIPYIQFVIKLAADFEKNPTAVIDAFDSVRVKMVHKTDMTVLTAGGKNHAPTELVERFAVSEQKSTRNYLGLPVPVKREAVIIRDTVNYTATAQVIPYAERMTALIASDILSNEYYTPKIRLEGGAYGGNAAVDRTIFYAYSLRDPNLDATVKIFEQTAAFKADLTNEKLVPYIISRYGNETAPMGMYARANVTMINYLRGYTPKMKYNDIESLKKTDALDVQNFITTLFKQNTYTTFGAAAAIKNSTLKYDIVLDMTK